MLALYIILPILMYLTMIGVTWRPFQLAIMRDCPNCKLRDGEWKHYGYHGMKIVGHGGQWNDAFFMHSAAGWWSLAWPFILPVFIGKIISSQKQTKTQKTLERSAADKIRRQSELDEQQHQVELAELRAKENRLLDEHIRREIQDR